MSKDTLTKIANIHRKLHGNQISAVGEGVLIEIRNAFGHDHVCQACASIKRENSDGTHAARNYYVREVSATNKSVISYACNPRRKGNIR